MNLQINPKIISASRKTDVPAFYAGWFKNRLDAGFVNWKNSFNNRTQQTSLKSDDVLGFVFWTRNVEPFFDCSNELRKKGYLFYFLYTINGYPKYLEPFSPALNSAIASFKKLSKRISPLPVFLRYDPIILTKELNFNYHINKFSQIVQALSPWTSRVYVSFVDLYAKTLRNLAKVHKLQANPLIIPNVNEKIELLTEFLEISAKFGLSLHSCCESEVEIQGVRKGKCVDVSLFEDLLGQKINNIKTSPTRKGCECSKSIDIGAYNTCVFGCQYCYATSSLAKAKENFDNHKTNNTFLI